MDNKAKKKFQVPISRFIVSALLFIVAFQAILFVVSIVMSGTNKELLESNYSSLVKVTRNKRTQLELNMLNLWGNSELMSGVTENVDNLRSLGKFNEMASKIEITENMIHMMNAMKLSAALLITDRQGTIDKDIIYVSDEAAYINKADHSDITLKAGSAEVARALKIHTGSSWEKYPQPSEFIPYEKYRAYADVLAHTIKSTGNFHVGTWEYTENNEGEPVFHYIVPAYDSSTFEVYGLLVAEIGISNIEDMFHTDELSAKSTGAFIIGKRAERKNKLTKSEEYEIVGIKGTYIKNHITDDVLRGEVITKSLKFTRSELADACILELSLDTEDKFIAVREELRHRDVNLSGEKYYLFSVVESGELKQNSVNFANSISLILLMSVLMGVIVTILISNKITHSLSKISEDIKKHKGDRNFEIKLTNILEFDNIIGVLNDLSKRFTRASVKFEEIMNISNIAIVAFEVDRKNKTVYRVGKLSNILDGLVIDEPFEENMELADYVRYRDMMIGEAEKIKGGYDEDADVYVKIYRRIWDGKERYIKIMKNVKDDVEISEEEVPVLFVIVMDVTNEISEQLRIKEQRDLDVLTVLLNRLSFKEKSEKFIEEDVYKKKKAAMVMWDMDELKFINDTYGHEKGDEYLVAMSNALKTLSGKNVFVARMSGDEFFAFIEYDKDKQEVRAELIKLRHRLMNTLLPFSNKSLSIKSTTGVSWYPDDSTEYMELIKFADFAMYTGKQHKKGTITEFNKEEYDKNYILLSGNQYFESFLKNREVRYAFQPIVDAHTGEIFAYEALMRPTSCELNNINQIMKFARKDGKLLDIEILTVEEVLKTVKENMEIFGDKKIFINSISNVVLPPKVIKGIKEKYGCMLERLVLEITEQEDIEDECMKMKQAYREELNFMMAIDDYGSGYSSQSWFLQVHPNFIKIDMLLIRGIDRDVERQAIIGSILDYAKKLNVKVVCEGIETKEELEKLIEMGADYIQGFYVSRPMFEIEDVPEDIKKEIMGMNKF